MDNPNFDPKKNEQEKSEGVGKRLTVTAVGRIVILGLIMAAVVYLFDKCGG
jgi:hypothetical protein